MRIKHHGVMTNHENTANLHIDIDCEGTANLNPYNAEIFVYKPWRPKGLFQFEIIINILVSSF